MIAKRVDKNHGQIVSHLRATGWRVYDSSALGRGFPDLVVAHERTRHQALVEIKHGKGDLNAIQRKFRDEWPGAVFTVRSPDDATSQLTLWLLSLARLK
jgi:hypothetical protein